MNYYTHAGLFHCDEVTGYAICEMAGVVTDFVRLTDLANIPTDGIIADIGREWKPTENKYDHHQGFFTRVDGYPLATAGMLWYQYGREVIKFVMDDVHDEDFITEVFARVDELLIKGIDAHDADSKYSVNYTCSAGDLRYASLSNVISAYNSPNIYDSSEQYFMFKKASYVIRVVLIDCIENAAKFVEAKRNFNPEVIGSTLILDKQMPWKEIVHEEYPDALFVISPSNHPGSPYSMIAVPVSPESREVKCEIERPEWFAGFIHQGKWIAGGTLEELKKLAEYPFD